MNMWLQMHFTLTLHWGSQCPLNQQNLQCMEGFQQHLFPVVKMTQHQGCFCPVIGRWRLVCCSVFSSKLCRIPYPKYMVNPSREIRWWEVKAGALLTYKCPIGLLLWHLTQFRGEVVGRGLGSVTQEASLLQKITYQSPSRCQIGRQSKWSCAPSGKLSQRCLPVAEKAKHGPVGSVSSSLNTP